MIPVEVAQGGFAQPLDPTDLTTANLYATACRLGLVISADNRVSEKDAALLLCCSRASLKAIRQNGDGPVFYAVGVDGSRLSYRLNDLAAWIEAGREDVMRRFITAPEDKAGQ